MYFVAMVSGNVVGLATILGFYIYVAINLGRKVWSKKFLLSLLILLILGPVVYYFGELKGEVSPFMLTLGYISLIALYFLFKNELLPKINEKTILLYIILSWYILLVFFNPVSYSFLYIVFGALTLIISYYAFHEKEFGSKLKILSYVIYLVILFVIGYWNIYSNIFNFFNPVDVNQLVIFEYIIMGFVIMHLFVSFYTIILLFGHDTYEKEKKHLEIVKSKYSSEQMNAGNFIAIGFLLIAVLIFNFYLKLIDNLVFVNVIIVILPFLSKINKK